ncbi:MAG TPA: 16S rRNA processing protein RimM [Firmicutes bacterium]|jgi:16S rRNA processing protein RimM|nr:16S rRNA processing protein RimM [Bacillota bacterium]
MVDSTELIAVGEIIKAQGVRGEFKVLPLTDDRKRFGQIQRVYFKERDGLSLRELKIAGYRPFQSHVLLRFEGIPDLTAAEALGRGFIYIPRSERPKLPAGRYYLDEIQGLKVYTVAGESLGTVREIIETGSNDVYWVEDKGGAQVLIPALKSVIREINLAEGKMVVELPPGLLEDGIE